MHRFVRRSSLILTLSLSVFAASAAYAQAQTDGLTPTIPETQLEPSKLSSPYEFLSVSTSASDFVIEAAALAEINSESDAVKSIAQRLSKDHAAMKAELVAAGKAQSVEIAKPAMDGEQSGLIGKLTPVKGIEFDSAYLDSQLFVHQRTIAYYRGYAEEDSPLGKFAKSALPTLVADYASVVALAEEVRAAAQPAPAN